MPNHVVAQGECLSSIAERYGFYWQSLWNDPRNDALRERGRHPNTLLPGDVVHIPEKRVKDYVRPTGARHTWRVKGVPAKIRLRLLWDDEPRAGEPYRLEIDGVVTEGTTDGDGGVEVTVPPSARSGRLTVGTGDREEEFALALGHLDPPDALSGVQARLANLGFDCPVSGALDAATRTALKLFQARVGLRITGEPDDDTRAKLLHDHDAR